MKLKIPNLARSKPNLAFTFVQPAKVMYCPKLIYFGFYNLTVNKRNSFQKLYSVESPRKEVCIVFRIETPET